MARIASLGAAGGLTGEQTRRRRLGKEFHFVNISVIGLGKLGAPLAAVLAHKGHSVIGHDVNAASVAAVNAGEAPVTEPGLAELFRQVHPQLSATGDCTAAVALTDATFVIVPTPSDTDGAFSMGAAVAAAEAVGTALRGKQAYHLVVLVSTVMPGATEQEFLPTLEACSGKQCGVEFGLCYSPEFIALGSVIRDLLQPDLVLIGESDSRAGDALAELYGTVHESAPALCRMSFVNAELTKLAVNSFVTTKISFANMLADLCERLPGADVDVVTGAVGRDSRIGTKFLRGATAYGGPCFPRDNVALATTARRVGATAPLAEATDLVNQTQHMRLAETVAGLLPLGGRVGILGLAYKPDTPVIEASAGMALAKELLRRDIPISVYDPAALPNAQAVLRDTVDYAASADACVAAADVAVVMTPWADFRAVLPPPTPRLQRPLVVVDCWRLFDEHELDGTVEYLPIGRYAAAAQIA